MRRYILSSPLLTSYGDFHYYGPIAIDEAKAFCQKPFESAVGHESTAFFLSELLEIKIAQRRIAIEMQPRDLALVFSLQSRLPEGALLSTERLRGQKFHFSILEKKEIKQKSRTPKK